MYVFFSWLTASSGGPTSPKCLSSSDAGRAPTSAPISHRKYLPDNESWWTAGKQCRDRVHRGSHWLSCQKLMRSCLVFICQLRQFPVNIHCSIYKSCTNVFWFWCCKNNYLNRKHGLCSPRSASIWSTNSDGCESPRRGRESKWRALSVTDKLKVFNKYEFSVKYLSRVEGFFSMLITCVAVELLRAATT